MARAHMFQYLPRMAPSPAAAFALDSAKRELDHDPVWQAALNAPPSMEPLSAEELTGLEEGMADIRAGRTVSREDILAR